MNYKEKFDIWVSKVKDCEIKEDLCKMDGKDELIIDAFYKDLEFGTSGLRGVMGAGTNRMNVYTVATATQGFANWLHKKKAKRVIIGYDSRINSKLFAQITATVLANNSFIVYITEEVSPTPYLSFIVREFGADAGIMITASHNPKEYNGYKVYGSDGCQLTEESSFEVQKEIGLVDTFSVNINNFEIHVGKENIRQVQMDVFERYIGEVYKQHSVDISNLKIAYTALNGAGFRAVPYILTKGGCKNISLVKEQCYPDGNFSTCPSPNPERTDTRILVEKQMVEDKCDMFIATDPDADRTVIGVNVDGQAISFNGHQMGMLLTYYLANMLQEKGISTKGMFVVKTIVTTNIIYKICQDYGMEVVDLLTGFKYIGEFISKLEKRGRSKKFLLGFEESCGFLIGDHVRDKDAVVSSLVFAEMCSYYKSQGKTLKDVLDEIYAKYGCITHKLISKKFDGVVGFNKMKDICASVRRNIPTNIGSLTLIKSIDLNAKNNEMKLPQADVFIMKFDKDAELIIRPSGTEPLLKFYLSAINKTEFDDMENYINEITK